MADNIDIFEAFRARAESHPDRTAVHYLGTKFSYGRILRDALAFASSLAAMGVGPDDRVMLYLPNCPQFIIAWLGTLARGAAVTPIAPIYTTRDLVYIANDTGAAAVSLAM